MYITCAHAIYDVTGKRIKRAGSYATGSFGRCKRECAAKGGRCCSSYFALVLFCCWQDPGGSTQVPIISTDVSVWTKTESYSESKVDILTQHVYLLYYTITIQWTLYVLSTEKQCNAQLGLVVEIIFLRKWFILWCYKWPTFSGLLAFIQWACWKNKDLLVNSYIL